VDCGGDALILQKLLGHSTLAMTKHYCAIYDTDISDSFDSFSPLAQLTKEKTRIRK
jgi:integrase/recombinase XerD